ncbi:hypothetical protein HY380_01985 [Candidatus Saccharibacteria bacterium]|nr:hypothetical protein [Candidatus Saccharibacteria bacterium]
MTDSDKKVEELKKQIHPVNYSEEPAQATPDSRRLDELADKIQKNIEEPPIESATQPESDDATE